MAVSYEHDADANAGLFSGMSGKKMALLVMLVIIGVFFGVQAMLGFPIKDLVRNEVTDQAKVVTKSQGTCVVIGSDQHPRGIPDCQYKIGDTLIITYKQGMAPVDKYQLKSHWYKEKFTLPLSFTTLSEEECNSFNMFYILLSI